MNLQKVYYLDFAGGVGFGGVSWWEGIPEIHSFVVVEQFSQCGLGEDVVNLLRP